MKNGNVDLIIGENIKFLRINHNLTKKKMCKIMGIGIQSFNKIESGVIPPRLELRALFALAIYFKLRPTYIFTKHGETNADANT